MVRNPPDRDVFPYRDSLREFSHWLLVVGLGFFLADAACGSLEQRLAVGPEPMPEPVVVAAVSSAGQAAPRGLIDLLATTQPAPVAALPASSGDPTAEAPKTTEATVTVTLNGCMAGSNAAGLAMLTVGSESLVAANGQPVLDWTIKEILPTSVVLQRGHAVQSIELDQPAQLPTTTHPPGSAPAAPHEKDVRETSNPEHPNAQPTPGPSEANADPAAPPTPGAAVGELPTQKEIRDLLDNHVADLYKQCQIKSVAREGEIVGYGIRIKDPTSPIARLGLQSGDIVKSVNGTPCTGPNDLPKLLGILRNDLSFSFELERRGQPTTYKVDIAE